MKKFVIATGLIALFSALGQTQTVPMQFDVATIKPSATGDLRFALLPLPGGRFSVANVPLKMLIMEAYGVKAFQVSGEPDWVNTATWDMEAKVEGVQGRLPQAQLDLMLRALLEDRFQLRIRRETKEMPVYALVVDRAGSKLLPHTGEPPAPGQGIRQGRGLFSVKNGRVGALSALLTRELGRVVIDKTELKGEYDYTLEWTPEPGQGGPESMGLPPQPAPATASVDTKGPSIFTALREQLGLRLESQKGPVETIVIERVEKPSAN